MSFKYLVGKQLSDVCASLERIEQRQMDSLDSAKQQFSHRDHWPLSEFPLKGAPTPSFPTPEKGTLTERTAGVLYRATDERLTRRVPLGDIQIVMFGFILDCSGWDHTTITSTILAEVEAMWDQDLSAQPDFLYNPGGFFPGHCCVFGAYSKDIDRWNWAAVEFNHFVDNPNSCFSKAYDWDGKFIQSGWSWRGLPMGLKETYLWDMWYADRDVSHGCSFKFQHLRKQ